MQTAAGPGTAQLPDSGGDKDDTSAAADSLLILSTWLPPSTSISNVTHNTPDIPNIATAEYVSTKCDDFTQVTPKKKIKYSTGTSVTPPKSVAVLKRLSS
jgi:hypothetical protein